MKCLIIAAGFGSRLSSVAESKPLAPIAGTPLIEHIIRRAASAGIGDFVVATGYRAEQVDAFLRPLGDATGLRIETVVNENFERPNGGSILAAEQALGGDEFLLLMSDHLFDPEIVRALLAARNGKSLTLAVDYGIDSPLIDMDDATKVAVAPDGAIRAIGKTLERFDAVDTGIFLTGPELPEAIRSSIARGAQGSLSDGVQALAARGEAWTFDIGNRWWLDVDDPRAFSLAEEALGRAA